MKVLIEWFPKLLACFLLGCVGLGLWFAGTRLGNRVSQRWPLGVAQRPVKVAAHAVFVVCVVVFVRVAVGTLGVTTDVELEAFPAIIGNTAAASCMASLGIVLLLGLRKLLGRVRRVGSPAFRAIVRYTGWVLSGLYLLTLGFASAILPASGSIESSGNAGIDNLARIFSVLGQIAVMGLFVWQLVPIVKNAPFAEG